MEHNSEFKELSDEDKQKVVEFMSACANKISLTTESDCIKNMSKKGQEFLYKKMKQIYGD